MGESKGTRNLGGLAFLGQAGVTLGFSVIIAGSFGGTGRIIVGAVGINQFLGPVALRSALIAAGEVGKKKAGASLTKG